MNYSKMSVGVSSSKLLAYGVLRREQRLEILRDGINTIILPGFESFGIDVTHARKWSESML